MSKFLIHAGTTKCRIKFTNRSQFIQSPIFFLAKLHLTVQRVGMTGLTRSITNTGTNNSNVEIPVWVAVTNTGSSFTGYCSTLDACVHGHNASKVLMHA